MKRQTAGDEEVLGWVEALRRGQDVEANSRRVFRRYYGWVKQFFVRRCPTLEVSEELAQETFFQAFRRIESFRGGGTFESWLFAIAANNLRNERRRLSRLKRDASEISLDAELPHRSVSEADTRSESPEVAALNKERVDALVRAIETLPEKQSHCLRLRLAGYDYAKIAELLKLSASTVRVHVHAARKRLQDELGEFGDSPE